MPSDDSLHPDADPLRLQRLLAQALGEMANAVFITDEKGRIVWVNRAFCRLSGYGPEEVIGQSPRLLKSGRQDAGFYHELWQTILGGAPWRAEEVVERGKGGKLYVVDECITPLLGERGEITHFVAVQNDVTRRSEKGDRERFLAYHDALTGLPNRALLFGALQQAVAHGEPERRPFALLYLDLDNFKPINDAFGHQLGDRLLIAVARRLRGSVREEDIVARLGGDEFAIVETELPCRDLAAVLARKLIRNLSRPFVVEGRKLKVSASIGIALCPDDGEDPEQLLREADMAMYLAKRCGPGHWRFHETRGF